jgi:hypothetical protein
MRKPLTAVLVLAALVLITPALGLAQEKTPPARPTPSGPSLEAFHLVVLLADNKLPSQTEGLNAATTKALKDAKDFLPFKNYRVVDTVLVRAITRATARVEGPNGARYSANIQSRPGSPTDSSKLNIQFSLASISYSGADEKHSTVIDTSFAMDVGETVVVGTSKLQGTDQALVLLLTAVPASALK